MVPLRRWLGKEEVGLGRRRSWRLRRRPEVAQPVEAGRCRMISQRELLYRGLGHLALLRVSSG